MGVTPRRAEAWLLAATVSLALLGSPAAAQPPEGPVPGRDAPRAPEGAGGPAAEEDPPPEGAVEDEPPPQNAVEDAPPDPVEDAPPVETPTEGAPEDATDDVIDSAPTGEPPSVEISTGAIPAGAVRRPPPPPGRGEGRPNRVTVHHDDDGFKLRVDGRDFMVFGMNWGYMPIGQNYTYDFWNKPDDFIEAALRPEMEKLRGMGVNTIRQYIGIPARWIQYIYETYGIFTILNHPMGRYGHSIDGVWRAQTDYSDPRTREVLQQEMVELVRSYRDTPGLLMWLLGNENNYGLYWSSAEVEDLPEEDREDARATYLYSLFGETIDAVHAEDPHHPVAIANGDLQFIDVIAEQCPNLDVMGSNVYRGASSRDLFDRVAEVLGVPFMYTEFGSDAFDAREGREDDLTQAEVLLSLWQEIYEQSYGKGRAENAIGGLIFQWSDGWWKYRQEENLDVHDENASWANAGYPSDYVQGDNNMNEEWFGICAKGHPDERGLYRVYCRTAYYVLREAFRLDPYAESTTLATIRRHYGSIRPVDVSTHYAAQQALNRIDALEAVRAVHLRMDFETFTTGGRRLNEPERERTRFDHMESFYFGFEAEPARGVRASLTLNVLGNVAQNPIDEIFYENRGLPRTVVDVEGEEVPLSSLERIDVYQASFSWEERSFEIDGFYRVGQYHWGHEGDFFHLLPETHYQEAVDTFDAAVPIGVSFTGKRDLEGLRLAFGPELWWGANPTVIGLYHRELGPWAFSVMHQEDFAQREAGETSSAVPVPRDRRTTLYLARQLGPLRVEVGGIMSGSARIGEAYEAVRDAPEGEPSYLGSGYYVIDDDVRVTDTFGAKLKLTLETPPFYWYMQGGYRGLVADAGWDPTTTFTGWSLKESGQGNHWAVSTGAAYTLGDVQIAPNFLVQRPLEGPLPAIGDFYDPATGIYYPGLNGRNQLDDPFWVRSNRETYGAELLIALDPTPATWMWAWDNARREDAPFAAALDLVYRIHPTIQDAGVGVTAEGVQFAFPTSAPAEDLWDVKLHAIANFAPRVRLVSTAYVGTGQANGDDERLIYRSGVEGRLAIHRFALDYFFRFGDWGPYDYYRDFNSTFPFQGMLDASYALGVARWLVDAYSRIGVRGTFRLLDATSGRYQPDPDDPDALGSEWEVRTYVQLSI